MVKDFTRPETLSKEEYLAELKKDYHNKDLFHKLSTCSQITIIQRIDSIENQIEEEVKKTIKFGESKEFLEIKKNLIESYNSNKKMEELKNNMQNMEELIEDLYNNDKINYQIMAKLHNSLVDIKESYKKLKIIKKWQN